MNTILNKLGRAYFLSISTLTPFQIDLLKIIALMTMITDHVNTIFLRPHNFYLYAIGRTAFPVFTLIWAKHTALRPERLTDSASRQWMWAIITQPVFWLAFRHTGQAWYSLNILFLFASCTQSFAWYHRYAWKGALMGIFLLMLLAWPLSKASYGVPGLVFASLSFAWFYFPTYTIRRFILPIWLLSLLSLNSFLELFNWPQGTLLFAIVPTLFFTWLATDTIRKFNPQRKGRFLPKRFFYYAYVGHLAVLVIISKFII